MTLKRGRTGRPVARLELTTAERETLQRFARGRTVSQALVLRSRMVLMCAEGMHKEQVAKALSVTSTTVGKWRRRFVTHRVEGLADAPRPNVHRKLSDERVEELVRLTLQTKPEGSTHWSMRKLAKKMGVSQSSVSRAWRAFKLKPHRLKTFTLSTDDFFVEKVRDIVGLYMNPPDHAVVLCIDEKSQVQALERKQPILPLVFGQPERATATYTRHGTTNLFAALDVATGNVIGECYPRKRAVEFRRFLSTVEATVPEEIAIHIVVDNSSIHAAPEIRRWLRKHPRVQLHFTPTYSSWLNLIERWFAKLTEDALRRGSHSSTRELRSAIESYIAESNDDPKPFVWTEPPTRSSPPSRASARELSLRPVLEPFADSGH